MVSNSTWGPDFTQRALDYWHAYSAEHDLSQFNGQVAAIDPVSGRVWIAESGIDVVNQVQAEVGQTPVFITRVGSDVHVRKGRR